MDKIDLSPENAECWLSEKFIPEAVAQSYLDSLMAEVSWRQDEIFMFGRWVKIPRLQNFMADPGISYTYSRLKMVADDWHPAVCQIKELIEKHSGQHFNAALLNLYRDGNDSMGWHQDNEPELGTDPIVASVSLGAERRFLLRHKKLKDNLKEINLSSGSLLWMGSGVQQSWEHSLPKTKRCQSPRINITFRQILSEDHSS